MRIDEFATLIPVGRENAIRSEKGFSRIQEKNTGNSGTIVADA